MMYRQEALSQQKWKSTAVLFSAIPSWLVFLLSFVITASFILYITFGDYTRRETILGEVVMQPHSIILSSSKSGYISERYIDVNQKIKKAIKKSQHILAIFIFNFYQFGLNLTLFSSWRWSFASFPLYVLKALSNSKIHHLIAWQNVQCHINTDFTAFVRGNFILKFGLNTDKKSTALYNPSMVAVLGYQTKVRFNVQKF